jgi:GrpB-like predicted nucleotidyltransferase (UPF0157 family)
MKEGLNSNEAGLIGGREKYDVEIHEYDERWPLMFEQHARIICKALSNVALRVEHIGSTSVPGLAAKPIIDILVVVANPEDETTYLPSLQEAGYELRVREPEFDEHRMVRTAKRDVHIHIFPPQSKEIGRYLAFRNQLRSSSKDRSVYEYAKRTLAKQEWRDTNDYADAKTEVVEAIIAKGIHLVGKGDR